MRLSCTRDIEKDKLGLFYQSKYDYYKGFIRGLIIVSSLGYFSFFATDCQIFGRFAFETLLPRALVAIPFIIFLIMHKKINDYKIMVPATYLMIHIIIWCTDWATYLLPDRTYAGEGMIVMNLIFVCAGFASPFWFSTLAHCLFLIDILIAHMFIVYDDLLMMILFNLPCVLAVCIMHFIMQKSYMDQYLTKKKLEDLVMHDKLTGVFNRNKLNEISNPDTEAFNFPRNMKVGILLSDIDFFKKVNDNYGHEIGDIILKHVATTIRDTVRASDLVIRWGGEEFIVIVLDCTPDSLINLAERLRQNIEKSDTGICPVTISIGATMYEGGSYHDCVEQADIALYKAKSSGRNKVVQYTNEMSM